MQEVFYFILFFNVTSLPVAAIDVLLGGITRSRRVLLRSGHVVLALWARRRQVGVENVELVARDVQDVVEALLGTVDSEVPLCRASWRIKKNLKKKKKGNSNIHLTRGHMRQILKKTRAIF
jgi:hypothetical protein